MNFRSIFLAFGAFTFGMVLFFALAEGTFRLLPVNDGLMAMPVNDRNPVFRFSPNRDITWSRDWNFSIINRIRVNNAGFVNSLDYERDKRLLMAIVGDSYVEAAMVPHEKTVFGIAATRAGTAKRIYSFAASGAPLSQYVVWSKEARENWGASALVVIIIANDFDESLLEYKSEPGFHYYKRNTNGDLTLHLRDYQPSALRRLLRKSAFMRYLALNLHALERVRMLINQLAPPAIAQTPSPAITHVGNIPAHTSEKRLSDSKEAVAAFLRDLVEEAGWQPSEVLFLVDGIRYPSDEPGLKASYFMQMREHFMASSHSLGFGVIDLDPRFFARHNADGSLFEFPTDAHWNPVAHKVAADALLDSAFFGEWLRSSKPAH